VPFWWHVRCLRVAKPVFPPWWWKHHHVFFLLVWHVKAVDGQFITNDHFFFFSPSFLSHIKKNILFIFGISISFLILLIFVLILDLFVKVLLVFNFILQPKFIVYYFFQFDPHSFLFVFLYVKVIFVFNLTL
jgi:hypothetical protein